MERRHNDGAIMDMLRSIRDTQLEQAEKSGLLRGDVNAVTARVSSLEKQNIRHWWVTVLVTPLLAIGHGVARKLGVNI